MKFRITLKDPDGVDCSVDDEVKRFMNEIICDVIEEHGLDADEIDMMEEQHKEAVRKHVREWLRYSEYVTLEIDTDAGTCTVVKP